jgi:hypothetical protein
MMTTSICAGGGGDIGWSSPLPLTTRLQVSAVSSMGETQRSCNEHGSAARVAAASNNTPRTRVIHVDLRAGRLGKRDSCDVATML